MSINQIEPSNKDVFISSDLALATVVSLYFPIVAVNKENPRKAVFVFNRSKNLSELVDKYWKEELVVEPRAYFDQLKSLKNRLYSSE